MIGEVLVGGIDPQGGIVADGCVQIERQVVGPEAVRAGPCVEKPRGGAGRLLDAIDDAAAAAAAKNQRVRPLEDLDPLEIVQAPEVLDVIPHAVEEEVSGGVLAPQGDLVAIAFALSDGNARNIAQNVAEAVQRLIVELGAGHDIDALGHVEKRCVGLGRGDGIDGDIALRLPGDDDRLQLGCQLLRRGRRREQEEDGRGSEKHAHGIPCLISSPDGWIASARRSRAFSRSAPDQCGGSLRLRGVLRAATPDLQCELFATRPVTSAAPGDARCGLGDAATSPCR